MNKIRLLITAALVVGVAALIASCSKTDAETENATNTPTTEQGVSVRVYEIRLAPFSDALQVTGVVKAFEDVMLSPEEGGVVKEWKVQKGQRVVKGEVLALLKDDILQPSYDAAAAQFKLSDLNFEKQSKVYSEQAISELQLKSAEYNRDGAKAQASLALARLERSRLRSPINGVLNDRFFDEGEFAPPAVPIAHLVNTHLVKIAAEVPEVHTAHLTVGTKALLTIDAFPGDTLRGTISFVASSINPSNRTLPVEIVLANPENRLKPEMIARVKLMRSARRNALLLSESVVQLVDKNRHVVFVEKDGRAEERVVKLGGRQGNLVEILDGLKAGDRVIVVGYQKLMNGRPVTVTG